MGYALHFLGRETEAVRFGEFCVGLNLNWYSGYGVINWTLAVTAEGRGSGERGDW